MSCSGFAGELAPDDERLAAVGRGAGDGAEPPRAVGVLLEAALEAQALLAVALERGAEGLRRGDVLDREADQPVEGLQQIDVDLAALVRAGPLDLEPVGVGSVKACTLSSDWLPRVSTSSM